MNFLDNSAKQAAYNTNTPINATLGIESAMPKSKKQKEKNTQKKKIFFLNNIIILPLDLFLIINIPLNIIKFFGTNRIQLKTKH